MKVYVDELPKDCIDCPCESEYYCNLLNEDIGCCKWGEIHKNCPLQPISDHDKQVRKEVVQEITELAKNQFEFLICDECYNTIDKDVYISSVALTEILDTILKEYQK